MSRVSENSSVNAINFAVGKTKSKVEDLQLKGSTLKRVSKPSDDAVGNVQLMAMRSENIDGDQYQRNLSFAQAQLSFTENVLEEMTDILVKAKELAIGQSSSIFSPEIRQGIAKEIHQLRQQMLGLGNKRIGNRYLFSGQKILTRPFDIDGKYAGDQSKVNIEINKDIFVPINVNGYELFYSNGKKQIEKKDINLSAPGIKSSMDALKRTPASENVENSDEVSVSIFDELRGLENALLTNNPQMIQGLLERLDTDIERIVNFRADIGAITNSISNAETSIGKTKLLYETHKSKIEDADVAELMTDLQKEQTVLKATYKASSNLMNVSLMDFLK